MDPDLVQVIDHDYETPPEEDWALDGLSDADDRAAQMQLDDMTERADHLRTLHLLSESYWLDRRYRVTPQMAVGLVIDYSPSVEARHPAVLALAAQYRDDASEGGYGSDADGYDDDHPWDPRGRDTIEPDRLLHYMALLDRIFFFDLLTRNVPREDKVLDDTPLVGLRVLTRARWKSTVRWDSARKVISLRTRHYVLEEPEDSDGEDEGAGDGGGEAGNDGGDGNSEGDGSEGPESPSPFVSAPGADRPAAEVVLSQRQRQQQQAEPEQQEEEEPIVYESRERDFCDVVCDLIRAMCCAYLDLFCTQSLPEYHDEVLPGKGVSNGWRYWDLVVYVMLRMSEWQDRDGNTFERQAELCIVRRDLVLRHLREKREMELEQFPEDSDDNFLDPDYVREGEDANSDSEDSGSDILPRKELDEEYDTDDYLEDDEYMANHLGLDEDGEDEEMEDGDADYTDLDARSVEDGEMDQSQDGEMEQSEDGETEQSEGETEDESVV